MTVISSKTDAAGQTYYYCDERFIAVSATSAQWPDLVMITYVLNSDLSTMVTIYTRPDSVMAVIEMVANSVERPF